MTDPAYKFAMGNIVSVRGMPSLPKMLVVGNQAQNDYGFGPACARLWWLDKKNVPREACLPESVLEYSGL